MSIDVTEEAVEAHVLNCDNAMLPRTGTFIRHLYRQLTAAQASQRERELRLVQALKQARREIARRDGTFSTQACANIDAAINAQEPTNE